MDRQAIIDDLEVIKEQYKTENDGAFPKALDEAIKIIKAVRILEVLETEE
jgi:hypothetical protein